VLRPHLGGPRNRGQLQGDLQQQGACPAIVIDGLDEAGVEAWHIADEVIRLLAATARVLIGTRDLPAPSVGRSLIETLVPGDLIDLGDEALREQTAIDVQDYIRKRLAGIGEA